MLSSLSLGVDPVVHSGVAKFLCPPLDAPAAPFSTQRGALLGLDFESPVLQAAVFGDHSLHGYGGYSWLDPVEYGSASLPSTLGFVSMTSHILCSA